MLFGRNLGLKAALGLAMAVGSVACGDDDNQSAPANPDAGTTPTLDSGLNPTQPPLPSPDGGTTTPVTGMDGGTTPVVQGVYAWMTQVPNADGNLDSYINVTRSPEFSSVDISKARMVAPYSGMQVVDGFLFIGDGNSPFVTKYKIEEDLSWTEVTKINFGEYPLPEGESLNFYFADFANSTSAFHHYGADKAFRVQWDPTAGKLTRNLTDTNLPESTPAATIGYGGNRSELNFWKGPIVRAFFSYDSESYASTPKSFIAVYDPTSGLEKSLFTYDNCPGLTSGTLDESGNLYFGGHSDMPVNALFKKGPASCVVKIKADGTQDTSFAQTDLTKYTGGHYGLNFRYVGGNKATAHILHEERITGVDFNGAIPADFADKLYADKTLWDVELIDLTAGTAKVVTGFAAEDDVGYYGRQIVLEGRRFIVVQRGDNAQTTAMYELNAATGAVTLSGVMTGELFSVQRLR